MLQIVIFSFNRALQLSTLLSSIHECFEGVSYDIDIIYNVSTDNFLLGYEKLINEYRKNTNIHFVKEENINDIKFLKDFFAISNKNELYSFIRTINKRKRSDFRTKLISVLKSNKSQNVMFLTDDGCFIEKVSITDEILNWINSDSQNNQFSLRMGIHMNNQPQDIAITNSFLNWHFYNYPYFTNWGYPFSVDAHIYNKSAILHLVDRCFFNNPSTFESHVGLKTLDKKLFGNGRSFLSSKILSFPINMVQSVAANQALNVSVEKLNDYYLQGYKLNYPVPNEYYEFQQYPDILLLNHPQKEQIIINTK